MIVIKPMEAAHLTAVHEIERECFSTPWSIEALEAELSRESGLSHYLVAVLLQAFCAPQVIGYIGMWKGLEEGNINNLAVREAHRRRKVASSLLEHIKERATAHSITALTLEVRVSNLSAQQLYTQHSFEIIGRRKGYYADTGEDAYIMRKAI